MAIDAAPNCTTFEEDLTGALGDLRGRLGEAIGSIGLAPGEPQEIARRLGISRNLTWKVSKVVCSEDVFEATQHMPGEEGIEILLNALGDAGVEAARIDAVRATTRRFDAVVESRARWAAMPEAATSTMSLIFTCPSLLRRPTRPTPRPGSPCAASRRCGRGRSRPR